MAQKNKRDIIRPITIMLDGFTSYHAWSQNMTIFLKGHKLWRYVTGSIPKPIPNPKSKATATEDASMSVVIVDRGVHRSGWVRLRGFFDPTHHGGSKKNSTQPNPSHKSNPTQPN